MLLVPPGVVLVIKFWLDEERLPDLSKASPVGQPIGSGPLPDPAATILTVPPGVILEILSKELAATYRLPDASNARPTGLARFTPTPGSWWETKVLTKPPGVILEIVSGDPPLKLPLLLDTYRLPDASNARPRGLSIPEAKGLTLPASVILAIVLLPALATYRLPDASNARP